MSSKMMSVYLEDMIFTADGAYGFLDLGRLVAVFSALTTAACAGKNGPPKAGIPTGHAKRMNPNTTELGLFHARDTARKCRCGTCRLANACARRDCPNIPGPLDPSRFKRNAIQPPAARTTSGCFRRPAVCDTAIAFAMARVEITETLSIVPPVVSAVPSKETSLWGRVTRNGSEGVQPKQ